MRQTKIGLLRGMLLVALVATVPAAANGARESTPSIDVHASNGNTPFQGDTPSLVTVSPNGDGFREAVTIRYHLESDARVRVDSRLHGVYGRRLQADIGAIAAGDHVYRWTPPPRPVPATYELRISA